jgi:hypothetical protein
MKKVDLLAFLGVLAMAVYSQWNAKDLLWGLWISSLSIGYLTLLAGFFGNVLQGRLMDDQSGSKVDDEKKTAPPGAVLAVFFLLPIWGIFGFSMVTLVFAIMAVISIAATIFRYIGGTESITNNPRLHPLIDFPINLLINFPAGIFIIAFFTIHFGGFHFVHSIFLNGFFPLLDDQPFGKTPSQTAVLFSDFIQISLKTYWPFIIASAASSFDVMISALKGERRHFILEPYKNVVKMHLMIFIIAFAGAAGLHQYILYAVLFLYFLPVKEMMKHIRLPTAG